MHVVAVVVTYQPSLESLAGIRSLERQSAHVLVVDNGSGDGSAAFFKSLEGGKAEVVRLGRNLGIGAAHNAGIARARELGAARVLLMDQDSVPEDDMVARLLEAERDLVSKGEKLGAVGPVFHDQRVGKSWPFYRLTALGMRGYTCDGGDFVACDFLISSGTLARMQVLDDVGGMNEGYFLEHVDTEWSLRARAQGYKLFGACKARMLHSLGDSAVPVPFLGRRVQVYQPYRHYYLFRNAVLLWRERHAPLPWKLNEAQRLLKRLVYFSLMVAPRAARLRYMLLGFWHGLLRRVGPLNR